MFDDSLIQVHGKVCSVAEAEMDGTIIVNRDPATKEVIGYCIVSSRPTGHLRPAPNAGTVTTDH